MENKFEIKLPFMKNSRAAKASAAAHKMRIGRDPYFDWTVILGFFIATIALCVSFSFALWNSVNQVSFDSSGAVVSSNASSTLAGPSLNMKNLQKVISVQSAKLTTASQYEQGYSGPGDPSL